MADRQVDPSRLQGEALRRWYLRSPRDVEHERQAAEARRYRDFFEPTRDVDTEFSRELERPVGDIDPGFSRASKESGRDVDPGFAWVPTGPNRWRGESGNMRQTTWPSNGTTSDGAFLHRGLAGPDDGGAFINIDSKARSQRKQWERREGQDWPRDPVTGRNYDRSHIIAKADGGPDTVENIRPQHPDEHRAEHKAKGDFARWGARGGRSKTSIPSKGGPSVRGLGLLGIIPNITGILSGRIRTDSFDNFTSDMMGFPSEEDRRRAFEDYQRLLNPKWKPGDPIGV